MAGDWIKWGKGLAARREVVVLASRLGRDRHEIAGRLMVLWEWCDDNIPDDDIDDLSLDASLFLGDSPGPFIDALVGLPGFADALASPEVCWLTARSGGRLTFPNFGRHNGTTAKTRALEARKKQRQREKSRGGGKPPSPELSRNDRDNIGTREEESIKRRNIPPPPPTPSPGASKVVKVVEAAAPSNDGADADWDAVIAALRSLGVATADRSASTARARGATAEGVQDIIRHFTAHPGAWTLGLLASRVASAAPGLAATAGWPPKASTAKKTAAPSPRAISDAEDFDAMKIVREGRRAGKSDLQIEADLERANLAGASARLGWQGPKEAMA